MSATMKCAVLYGPRDIRLETAKLPETGADSILIRIKRCGICGTGLHTYRGEVSAKYPHAVLETEFSGNVAEVGTNVDGFKIGDRVVAKPYNLFCGKCYFCQRGRPNLCDETGSGMGSWHPNASKGGHSEYIRVPYSPLWDNVVLIPDEMSMEEAAEVEPLSCALHAVRRAKIEIGDAVVVLGAGNMGQLSAQLARISGAKTVIVTDVLEQRLKVSKKLGADETINAMREDVAGSISKLTHGRGADVVIEAVGGSQRQTLSQAIEVARKGGRVMIMGSFTRPVELDIPAIWRKELDITTGKCEVRDFRDAIHLIHSKKVDVKALVTHVIPMGEIKLAFEIADKALEGAIKVQVDYE